MDKVLSHGCVIFPPSSMGVVFEHAEGHLDRALTVGEKSAIPQKLDELKKIHAREQNVFRVKQSAQKMLEIATAAEKALKRKHVDEANIDEVMDELCRHAETIAPACKKLKQA